MIGLLKGRAAVPLLGDTMSELARRHAVPGAQLAIYHDGDVSAVEFGELEHRGRRPVTRDTAFPIGSITKSFTATLAMVLVADGDLELDAPLGDYVSDLDEELSTRLTLRQLLSHTAGLVSDPDLDATPGVTPRRYLADHCHRGNLLLPPGTGFSYSNAGYVLAGHLIETVTGMSWWEAVESILLRPLGIAPAFVGGGRYRRPGRPVATGHSVNAAVGRTRPVQQSLAPAEAPTAALAVSALDLVALGLMHVGDGMPDLLPAGTAAQLREPVPAAEPFGLADGWGLGLALYRNGGTHWVGHDGNADGTACYLRVDPVGGWVVGFTSNANTGRALWKDVLAELAAAGVPVERPTAWVPRGPSFAPPSDFAGTYANGDVGYVVAVRDGRPHISVEGDPFVRLTVHADLTFSLRDPSSGRQAPGGRFVRDPATGDVHALQVGGRLAVRRGYTRRDARRQRVA